MLITADRGNAEQVSDSTDGQLRTAHTCISMPLLLVGSNGWKLAAGNGFLCDMVPVLLALVGWSNPQR